MREPRSDGGTIRVRVALHHLSKERDTLGIVPHDHRVILEFTIRGRAS